MKAFRFSKLWGFIGILLAGNLAVWIGLQASGELSYGKLVFFDVGQGDAIYFRTPAGNDILIDTGPGDAVLSKLGKVMPFFDRSLELVILTHPHADHIAGMVEILKRYRVGSLVLPEVSHVSATYTALLEQIQEKNILVVRPRIGQRFWLDAVSVLDVYYPVWSEFNDRPKDLNDVSVVGKLSLGKSSVLLMGDSGKIIENLFLAMRLPLSSEILKIGHHGSRHSTSPEFLREVQPQYSIISVGRNPYGHPHPEVLGILQKATTTLLRTDEAGDLVFLVYPEKILLQNPR